MNNDQLGILLNLLTPTAENINQIIKDVNQLLDGKLKTDIKITLSNDITSGLDKLVAQIESINSITSSIVGTAQKTNEEILAIKAESNAKIAQLDAEAVAIEEKTAAELKMINSERVQNEELTAAQIEKTRLESALLQEQIITESAKTQKNNAVAQYAEEEGMLSGHLNNFKNQIEHHLSWLASAAVMYGGFEIFKESIIEIDKGMAGLRQTLEASYSEMGKTLDQKEINNIANQFMDIAKQYGESMNELLDGAKLVSRQYKDMGEIMAFVRSGTQLQIIDNLSLTDSFRALEAITNQYSMVAKSAGEAERYTTEITDKLSSVSHNAAISAKDLVDGLERSGSILHEMGVSLDESLALITAGVRSTQLSGSQIGQTLKSIAGSIKSGESVKELEKLGISIKDVNGNFKSLTSILEEVMIKSIGTEKSLDEVYKAISGGKFNFSKTAATLMDYNTYVETLAISLASAGKTHEYLGAQMDTVVKHAQLLKSQLVGLMNEARQGGLTTVIKGLIDGLTEFIKWVDHLNAYNVVMVGGIGALITIGLRWGSIVSYIKELTAAWAVTQEVLNGVTGNWIPLIVGGIGALMAYGYATQQETDAVNQQIEAKKNLIAIQEKEQKQIMDNFDASKQQLENDQKLSQFISDMADKHAQLTEALSHTSQGTKEYQQISDALAATEKATTIALDAEGKKRLELAGFTQQAYNAEKTALSNKIEQDKKLYDESLAKAKEYTQNQLNLTLARIDALRQESEAEQIAANAEAKRLNDRAEK